MAIAMANIQLPPHPHHLPEDVIEAILIRLPVKSLVRFRCVSKPWSLLFKSSTFVYKHFLRNKDKFIAVCFTGQLQVDKRLLAVCPFEYDHTNETSVQQVIFHSLPMPNFVVKLVGDCNGLLCVRNFTAILLLNPSLKQVKLLTLGNVPESLMFAGFGFDSTTMDFKVVRLLSLSYWGKVVQQRAQVYSLKSNAWRIVSEIPLVIDYSTECSTFFNGVVHWCVRSRVFGWRILTFNVATELFNQMEFPQDWDKRESLILQENVPSLFVLHQEESLAFVSCCHPLSSTRFVSVWTMKEGSWTKLYSIGPLPEVLKPISFSHKYKLLYETFTGKLILYDLLNHHSSVVCEDLSQLQPYDARWSDLRLEIGECRSSLFSINT